VPDRGLLDRERALALHRTMLLIRAFETQASALYKDGRLPGFIHLSIGQEACAAGACAALEPGDWITSTHRGHGHCLAKGADPRRMMAELFARADGYSRGRGGSMHIADVSRGVLGANGIVGQSVPLAVGAAYSAQVRGEPSVAVAFFGEGASSAGAVHEAMNIAALWRLPVVFFCEANGYAELTAYETHVPVESIAVRAQGYGFPGVLVDGNDVTAVHAAVHEAAGRARRGEGPTLIEARTLRWHGHYEGDPQSYKKAADRPGANLADPIVIFAEKLAGLGVDAAADAAARAWATTEIEAAIAYAEASPPPTAATLLQDVYAGVAA